MDVSRSGQTVVIDKNGVRGFTETGGILETGESRVAVRVEDGRYVEVPADLLVVQNDGSRFLDGSFHDFERTPSQVPRTPEELATAIPVVEEELDVRKRPVETGRVRVSKVVHEREEVVDVPYVHEEIEIRRVPVNRPVEEPVSVRYEGDTLIIPLLEEVVVVEKRLVLKEELYISKKRDEMHHPEHVKLRREEVVVEHVDARQEGEEGSPLHVEGAEVE